MRQWGVPLGGADVCGGAMSRVGVVGQDVAVEESIVRRFPISRTVEPSVCCAGRTHSCGLICWLGWGLRGGEQRYRVATRALRTVVVMAARRCPVGVTSFWRVGCGPEAALQAGGEVTSFGGRRHCRGICALRLQAPQGGNFRCVYEKDMSDVFVSSDSS